MHHFLLFALMLFAGLGIPLMAALNTGMGKQLSNPIAAALILCIVASFSSLLLLATTQRIPTWGQIMTIQPGYLLGGVLFVFYIGSITYSAPKIGLGNAVLMVLMGQLISAAVIDHLGLFGVQLSAFTPTRFAGFCLMALGFWLTVYKPG